MPLYFAYGSNMDIDAMAARCPASCPIGPARLMRHRFVMMREGFASVVRDPARVVHGLLWRLALADVAALDRYEDVGRGLYAKIYQTVATEQGARRALVYVGSNTGPGRAGARYMQGIIAAAEVWDLPGTYVAELRAHLPERPKPAAGARAAALTGSNDGAGRG